MATQAATSNGGLGVVGLLGVLFIALKLTHVIAWSWCWVLAPFWMPVVILIVVCIIWLAWMLKS